jgi:hypothetical protein
MDNNTNSKTIFYFIGIVVALAILGWLFYSFGGSKMNQGSNSSNTSNEVVNTNKVVPPADASGEKLFVAYPLTIAVVLAIPPPDPINVDNLKNQSCHS